MSNENKENIERVATISMDTKVVFSLKMYLSTIGSIIGIFYLFYTLVINPQIKENKEKINKLTEVQIQQLIEYNNSITILNSTIEVLSKRFDDINTSVQSTSNTGGSFGVNGGMTSN